MSNNFTITLSLGSGPEAEALALRIKAWAGPMPVSAAIRNLIKAAIDKDSGIGQKTQSDTQSI